MRHPSDTDWRLAWLIAVTLIRLSTRYPNGSLWILNRVGLIRYRALYTLGLTIVQAKILRMSYDTQGAIKVLQDGLKPERPHTFAQADGLVSLGHTTFIVWQTHRAPQLIFELAWTLLSQRRYKEAADTFIDMTKINSWSHGTYYFIAAGVFDQMQAENDIADSP